MDSAAIWLEKLGIPPREVCLDWAWQIQAHFAGLSHSAGKDTATLSWQRIEVSDSGELVLPNDWRHYSPDDRLQELLSWAHGNRLSLNGSNGSDSSVHSRDDLVSELRALTLGFAGLTEDSTKLGTSSLTDTLQFASPQAHVDSMSMRSRSKVKLTNLNRSHRILVTLKQHWLVVSLAAVILCVGCFIALHSGTGKNRSAKSVELAGELASGAQQIPELRTDKSVIGIGPELDDSASLDTLTEMPQIGVIDPEFRGLAHINLPSVSSAGLAGNESNGLHRSEPLISENGNQTTEATQSDSKSSDSLELTERDVMHELQALTESGTHSPMESDMAVPDSEDSNTIAEPLTLRTSPMLQTQKLAAKIKVRPRRPVWQIELSVDDEFELVPKEPQSVTDRQVTTWFLADSDSKDSQVRLVIQAQAAIGRQTALRWRVFAGAEDLPNLMLPLDKAILQPFQERLRIYSQLAQGDADRLKQLASGAEKDLRAAFLKQRANLESQIKLASRLSTIVAEAQLLDDLLRSQVTLYAKLRDGDAPDAATLLQFGDLSKQLPHGEAAKPAVIAE